MRLDRFVCKSTDLGREAAREAIAQQRVRVNGSPVADCSSQVHENNLIELDGVRLQPRPFRYLMLHKPAGVICSNVDGDYPSLFSLLEIERPDELHIVGRLDVDTTGLVLITDDGRWSFGITRPEQKCGKVYRVGLRDAVPDNLQTRFSAGIQLQGEPELTRPAQLQPLSSKEVLLTITEGRFHQVKRMFATVGNRVQSLHREQIGALKLDLEPGQWRYLTADEVALFS